MVRGHLELNPAMTDNPSTVNPDTFPKLQRYAKFAAASGDSYCSIPPYGTAVQNYINVESTQTQATLFRDDSEQEFILAFPGSSQPRDYITDADESHMKFIDQLACEGCYAHQGFLEAWLSAIPDTKGALHTALGEYKDYNITVAGYSLGGALASLAFSRLTHLKFPVTAAYTYGEPRVGNQKYADHIDKLSGATEEKVGIYHRVTHSYDGVPQAPAASNGFVHSRTEFFEADPVGAYNTYRCFGQEADDCNKEYSRGFINNAHFAYSGISMISDNCRG